MSRHPSNHTEPHSSQEKVAEEYINYVATTSTPSALTLSMIAEATRRDPTLRAVIDAIQSGKWYELAKRPKVDSDTFRTYERLKDELTIGTTTQVILRITKLVIPNELQHCVVELAHEGHQGITKTKSLLREQVWFPGINKMVEDRVKSCLACQVATPKEAREPLKMSHLPNQVWEELSIDFAELSTGDYLLVVSDDYSRYPVVEIIRSLAAQTVIPKLQHIFSQFGIPGTLKSDNGPPFNSEAFATFAANLGFTHRKITPHWPRANGEVERFMRTVKKIIKIALSQQKPWRDELTSFLRNFRATPHSSTGKAQATAFFNRQLRTKLPAMHNDVRDPAKIQEADQKAKERIKKYADSKAYVKSSKIRAGDTVVLKRDHSYCKSQTPYESKPYKVTVCKGSMITARRGERTVTRNSSFFKLVRQNDEHTGDNSTDGEYDYFENTNSEPDNATPADEQPLEPRRYPQRVRAPPRHLADYASK